MPKDITSYEQKQKKLHTAASPIVTASATPRQAEEENGMPWTIERGYRLTLL